MRILKPFTFIFLSFILSSTVVCQKIDSLNTLLRETTDVKKRAGVLYLLSIEYQNINTDSASAYIHKALLLHEKFNLEDISERLFATYADVLVLQDSLAKALEFYESAKKGFLAKQELNVLSKVYLITGNIYMVNNDYPMALTEYLNGLNIADSLHINELLPHFYNNIGSIYHDIKSDQKAYNYFEKAAQYFLNLNDSANLALVYSNIGNIYKRLDQRDLSLDYLSRAREIFTRTNSSINLARIYISFGNLYLEDGEPEKALKSIQLADSCIKQHRSDYLGPRSIVLSTLLITKGDAYSALGEMELAKEAYMESYDISRDKDYLQNAGKAALGLSKIYDNENNFEKALLYHKKYFDFIVRFRNDEKINELSQKELDYAVEKQERLHQIEILRQQNEQTKYNWLWGTIILSFLLISIILFMYYRIEKSKRIRARESEKTIQLDLDYKNKELTTFVIYLMKKNELVLETSKKLKELKLSGEQNNKLLQEIILTLDVDSSTDLGKEFDMRFKEVHTGFYKNLSNDFPTLTTNELRLCAFLRLNMNTKDISSITFQSTNSITVARHRLRQKFGLSSDDNLAGFLSQY